VIRQACESVTEPASSGITSRASSTAGVGLLDHSRKTEGGAGEFLMRFMVRAAFFALPAGRGSVFAS
jgi:hypothetical protein